MRSGINLFCFFIPSTPLHTRTPTHPHTISRTTMGTRTRRTAAPFVGGCFHRMPLPAELAATVEQSGPEKAVGRLLTGGKIYCEERSASSLREIISLAAGAVPRPRPVSRGPARSTHPFGDTHTDPWTGSGYGPNRRTWMDPGFDVVRDGRLVRLCDHIGAGRLLRQPVAGPKG